MNLRVSALMTLKALGSAAYSNAAFGAADDSVVWEPSGD